MSQPSVLRVPPAEVLPRALVVVALLCPSMTAASGNAFVQVTGVEFSSALPTGRQEVVKVRSFLLQEHPVTNAEFLAFVTTHAEWRRDAAPTVLAGADYLGHWSGPLNLGARAEDSQPVSG